MSKNATIRVVAPSDCESLVEDSWDGIEISRFRYAKPARQVMAYTGSMHKVALKPWNWLLARSFLRNAAKEIRRKSEEVGADVLYAHWILPSGMFSSKARRTEKLVIHVHGTDYTLMKKSRILRFLSKRVLRKADGILCVSEEQAELVRSMVNVPVRVRSMGVDLSRFHGEPRKEFKRRVLFVGRITQAKGVELIVECAFALPDWKFTIIGDGPYMSELKELAEGASNIELRGAVANDDLPQEYAQSDIFLLPSEREGMPVSIIEALACGLPVIATDVGQISEVVSNGDNGYLVKAKVDEIVDGLCKIDADENWKRMSINALGSVSSCGMDQVADDIISFMEEL